MKRKKNLGSIIIDNLRLGFLERSFGFIGDNRVLLDLGCGKKPYKDLYSRYTCRSVGIDVMFSPHDSESVDAFFDGEKIPFKDSSFDIILCTEVLEHVPKPEIFLKEIYRVLDGGGYLILTTPFLIPLHENPFDFYRYSNHALDLLLKESGFCIDYIEAFSDIFGVSITFLSQIQLKFWYVISKALRFPLLNRIYNPFNLLFVYIPQKIYLGILKLSRFFTPLHKILSKMKYAPLGFGLVAIKE